jgi:hypothetical protein
MLTAMETTDPALESAMSRTSRSALLLGGLAGCLAGLLLAVAAALAVAPENIAGAAWRCGAAGLLGGGFVGGLAGLAEIAFRWRAGVANRVAIAVPALVAAALLLAGWAMQ